MKDTKISRTRLDHLNSHGGGLSRRQFVGLGLLGATSTLILPSPLKVFSNAFAAETLNRKRLAYLGFDLAGGAGLSGNFLVGKQDGPEDLLKSYSRLGWNPRTQGYDSRFGLPMAKADVSQLFKGMIETMSPAAQANFRMASFCHVSRDDTTDNPLSVVQMISKIQSRDVERFIKKPLGMSSNTSGGNSRSVKELSDFSAVKIATLDDVINLASIQSSLSTHTPENFKSILGRLTGLSRMQVGKLYQEESISSAFNKSYSELEGMAGAGANFDPRLLTDTQKVYALNRNTALTNRDAIRAGIVSATLKHDVGGAVMTIGGCDYHDGTSTTGDAKDLEIGREIGRAVELAHIRQEALFIHIYSDGAVSSVENGRKWSGDDGEKSMSVIGLYDPKQAPTYRSNKNIQIGSYTDGQGADRSTLIGGSPATASYAVLVNYLSAAGMIGEIDTYMPRIFTTLEQEQIIAFNA